MGRPSATIPFEFKLLHARQVRSDHLPNLAAFLADEGHANLFELVWPGCLYESHQDRRIGCEWLHLPLPCPLLQFIFKASLSG
jgi:hypothetical protein